MDYFENYQGLPKKVQDLYDKIPDDPSYKDLEGLRKEFNKVGCTFSFGLDAQPFNLRPQILTT